MSNIAQRAATPQTRQKQDADSLRNSLRSKILGKIDSDSEIITFRGVEIELRQPTVKEVIERGESGFGVVDFLIDNAYIPGTNIKVFEDADKEVLEQIPFGPDVSAVIGAIGRLTGLDVESARKK